jgi:16S rRNA (cytosine1402-N4)-methyltransferase
MTDAHAIGFHAPVMVGEVLSYLEPKDGLYLDGTAGGGGHSLAILEHCPSCRIIAVDRDPDALRTAEARLAAHSARVRFLATTFDEAVGDAEVREHGIAGALLDLGISSHQIDEQARGFSFQRGAPLDMRMEGASGALAAADLLNEASDEELAHIFREFGEEPRARRLAREVVRRRENRLFATSDDLVGALSAVLQRSPTNQDKARIFQALRIAVNEELEILSRALPELREALLPAGVLVVIAYHSLEDRIVKTAFREWSRECVCPPGLPICVCRGEALGETLTRKPVRPTADEVERNPRARSALLRAWRKAA